MNKNSVLIFMALLGVALDLTNAQTSFNGPINIQTTVTPTSALFVQRYGAQASAIDLLSNGGGGKCMRILAPDGVGGQQVMSYISDTGEWFSRSKMVVSGAFSSALPSGSDILSPTADATMFGLWSDIQGPTMVIRPHQNNPPTGTNATLSTMDGAGKYRFSIYPDGSLNFAAANSNTFNSAGFDTNLYRTGSGQLATAGNFSANSINDTSIVVTLVNNSASSVTDGMLVVADPSRDSAFLPATADMDTKVLGVAQGTIPAGASGLVAIQGVRQVSVTGTINPGDRIVTAAGTGIGRKVASGETPPAGCVIGKATGTPVSGKAAVMVTTM